MSELKATPGPWLVATSCSWRRIVSERGDPVCIPTIQRRDNHPDLHFPNGGEDGPDARMLAASRQLYELLEQCRAMGFLTVGYDSGADHKRLCSDASSVLAKVRGEQS